MKVKTMLDKQLLSMCRNVDLYDFLLEFSPEEWTKESSKYLRHKEHSSCIVTKNKGYVWNSHNLKGRNPIDFLIVFYNFSFFQAVQAVKSHIIYFNAVVPNNEYTANHSFKIAKKPWAELFSYLCIERNLEKNIIERLVNNHKILLTAFGKHKNICFYDDNTEHYECIGIGSERFKQVSDGIYYWSFGNIKQKAYICESAIDAISLYQLLKEQATYISIAGSVTRNKIIDKIIKNYDEVILAVDNDSAGNKVAAGYPDLKRIIPMNKDWNEDLNFGGKGSPLIPAILATKRNQNRTLANNSSYKAGD